jgi:DNA helicase II / ATP-dependent DNA helicase PcrA
VHAAKGLEFDAVFITGLEEALFPHENSLSDRDGLEEERRLMYVAITRARKRLYLSHAQTRMLHGSTRYNIKSRFLEELPEASLKWLTPKRSSFASGMGGGSTWGKPKDPWAETSNRAPWMDKPSSRNTETWGAGAVPAQKAESTGHGLKVNMQVFHNKFGQGKVLALEGAGTEARAQVNFSRHGVKWLALSVAKLTPVDG